MEYFAKSRLKNNVSYFGIHELTTTAKWDAREGCFWYVTLDYQRPTMVRLMHPADGGSFKPIAELFGEGDTNTKMNGIGQI